MRPHVIPSIPLSSHACHMGGVLASQELVFVRIWICATCMMVYIWGLVLNCLYLNNIWPVLCVKQDCYSMNGLSRSWAQWSLDLFPAVGPLLLGFTVCAALPPAATDWIQWRRGGRDETWKCVCVCGCKGDLNTRCGLECLHTLKHKDESDEEKGGGVALTLRR